MPRWDIGVDGVRIGELELMRTLLVSSSTSATGRAHNTDPSAISKLLKRFEAQFDEPLFERRGKRLIRTERGQQLLPLIERALQACRNLTVPEATKRTAIRLAADPLLMPALCEFMLPAVSGGFDIRLLEITSEFATELVQRGLFDIGFFFAPLSATGPWIYDEVCHVPFFEVSSFPDESHNRLLINWVVLTRQGTIDRRIGAKPQSVGQHVDLEKPLLALRSCERSPTDVVLPAYLLPEIDVPVAFEQANTQLLVAVCNPDVVQAKLFNQLKDDAQAFLQNRGAA